MSNPFERLGVIQRPGSSVTPGTGYHNLPFEDYEDAPVHRRGTANRVLQITRHYKVEDKRGLDLGCSVGGLTFGLQMSGAQMTGVDADPEAVKVALSVEAEQGTGARFSCRRLPIFDIVEPFDFAVCYSVFMWIAKAEGMDKASAWLSYLSERVPVLFFETAQAEGDGSAWEATPFRSAGDVREFLLRFYPVVEDIGIPTPDWFQRNVFYCHA